MSHGVELLLINPGGREEVYQGLSAELMAVEPPLWCRLIAGYVRDRGWSVAILDSQAEAWGPAQVAGKVREMAPRLVGMVVYGHQPSASTQSMTGAGQICRAIKELLPEQPILLAGGHPAALPEKTLRGEAVDFVCNSEGPITFHQLLHLMATGESWRCRLSQVEGLVYWQEAQIQSNPAPPLIHDLDGDLHGAVWDLLPMEKYRAHNWHCFDDLSQRQPYAAIYTSLGCPFHCSFCCINAPFGIHRYRRRSPQAVVAEIDHLVQRYGVKTFKFADEMFVLHTGHVTAICDLLIERNHDLNIWAYARVDTVKPRLLDKLRRAGFRWLALGIESGSAHVRDGAEKSLGEAEILTIVRQIQEAGISVIGNYIFGLPDDDEAGMRRTLDLAVTLNCEFANFYAAMAYPGSALYGQALAAGWELPEQWSGYSQHAHDCHPLPTAALSSAQVLAFRDRAFHEYFSHPDYLALVERRFGGAVRRHIEEMSRYRLPRRLLENGAVGP